MREGAFALVDCLGFKGIWRRANPDHVLEQLKNIKNVSELATQAGSYNEALNKIGIKVQVAFLSDTVAIGVLSSDPTHKLRDLDRGRMLSFAAQQAQKIVCTLLCMEQPLTCRGSITFGEFEIDENFIIGPAVDQAAELHETSDGAFVWLDPAVDSLLQAFCDATIEHLRNCDERGVISIARELMHTSITAPMVIRFASEIEKLDSPKRIAAVELLRKMTLDHLMRRYLGPLIRYDVPLKDRRRLIWRLIWRRQSTKNAWTVSPFIISSVAEMTSTAMQSASDGVRQKRQHTLKFLEAARSVQDAANDAWREMRAKAGLPSA